MSSCSFGHRALVFKKSRSNNGTTSLATKRQPNRRASLTRAFNPAQDGRYAMSAALYARDATQLASVVQIVETVPQIAWRTLVHMVCLTVHRRDVIATLSFLLPQQSRQSSQDSQACLLEAALCCIKLTPCTMSYEYFSSATLCPPARPLDSAHTPCGIAGIGFFDGDIPCPYDVLHAFEAIHTELRVHQNVRGALQAAFAVIWADHTFRVTAGRSTLGNDPKGRAFGMSVRRALGLGTFFWSTTLRAELAGYAQLAAIAQSFVPPRSDVVDLCRMAFDTVIGQRFFNPYSLVTAIVMALMFADMPTESARPDPTALPLMQSVRIGDKASPALSPEDWVLADHCVVDRSGHTTRTLLDRSQTEETGCLAKLEDRMLYVLTPAWKAHFPRAQENYAPPQADDSSATDSTNCGSPQASCE